MVKEFGEKKKVSEEQLMKVIMSTIRKKVKGYTNGLLEIFIKAVLLMIYDTAMEKCTGVMGHFTKVIGLMGFKKERVSSSSKMGPFELESSGKMSILVPLSLNYL